MKSPFWVQVIQQLNFIELMKPAGISQALVLANRGSSCSKLKLRVFCVKDRFQFSQQLMHFSERYVEP